jgi:plasmid stability protein
VNLTIKNIPEPVYKSLKQQAARQGRSLNSLAIQALTLNAQESERRKQMRATRADLEKFVASLPPMPDSVPLLRAERRSH